MERYNGFGSESQSEVLIDDNHSRKPKPFMVDTKGMCLLCFSSVPLHSTTESFRRMIAFQFQTLTRHLNINLMQVIGHGNPHLQSGGLLKKMVELDASFCSACSHVVNKCFQLYQEFEVTSMLLSSCIQEIRDLVAKSDRDHSLVEEYWRRTKMAQSSDGVKQAIIVENMRETLIEKCSTYLRQALPRVNLDRPNRNNVRKRLSPSQHSLHAPIKKLGESGNNPVFPQYSPEQGEAGSSNSQIALKSHEEPVTRRPRRADHANIFITTRVGRYKNQRGIWVSQYSYMCRLCNKRISNITTHRKRHEQGLIPASARGELARENEDFNNVGHYSKFPEPTPHQQVVANRQFISDDPDYDPKGLPVRKRTRRSDFADIFVTTRIGRYKNQRGIWVHQYRHVCRLCNKRISNVTVHRKLHTREKSYQCPHCSRGFIQSSNLQYHVVSQHIDQQFRTHKHSELSATQFQVAVELLFHNLKRFKGESGFIMHRCPHCPTSSRTNCYRKMEVRTHMLKAHRDALIQNLKELQQNKEMLDKNTNILFQPNQAVGRPRGSFIPLGNNSEVISKESILNSVITTAANASSSPSSSNNTRVIVKQEPGTLDKTMEVENENQCEEANSIWEAADNEGEEDSGITAVHLPDLNSENASIFHDESEEIGVECEVDPTLFLF